MLGAEQQLDDVVPYKTRGLAALSLPVPRSCVSMVLATDRRTNKKLHTATRQPQRRAGMWGCGVLRGSQIKACVWRETICWGRAVVGVGFGAVYDYG